MPPREERLAPVTGPACKTSPCADAYSMLGRHPRLQHYKRSLTDAYLTRSERFTLPYVDRCADMQRA